MPSPGRSLPIMVFIAVLLTVVATVHAQPPTPSIPNLIDPDFSTDQPDNVPTSTRTRVVITSATTFNATSCTAQPYDGGCLHLRIEITGGDYVDFDRDFGAPTDKWRVYDEVITADANDAFRNAVYAMLTLGDCAALDPFAISESARTLILQTADCPLLTLTPPMPAPAAQPTSATPTLQPTHLTTNQPLACNQPAPAAWPPDGCTEFADIAPPNGTIPFACLRSATTDTYAEDGFTYTTLMLKVNHPEANNATTWTLLSRARNVLVGVSFKEDDPALAEAGVDWHWQRSDWNATCGKDDAQLTWATLAYLNSNGDASVWRIYQSPPPRWFVRKLDAFILDRLTVKRYFPHIANESMPWPSPSPNRPTPLTARAPTSSLHKE